MDDVARGAYAAAVAALRRRKAVRDRNLRTWRFDDQVEQILQASMDEMAGSDCTVELTQLAVHASPDVVAALHAAEVADNEAYIRYAAWVTLADQNRQANVQAAVGLPANFVNSETTMAAFNTIKPGLEAANQADDTLAALITAHLEA